MNHRFTRARMLALTLVIALPLVGITTTADARPSLHHSTRSDGVDDTWTASEVPVPANARPQDQRVWITGTACPAAGTCVAVGYYNTQGDSLGLIDTISDGTSTLTEAPVPAHGNQGDLLNITCSSVAFCVAIGSYGDDLGLIDTLSDGTWKATKAPLPPGTPAGSGVTLSAVTCPADGSCVVVGGANFSDPDMETIPFIDTLSDGNWTSTEAPLPAGAMSDFYMDGPTAVSCPAVGSCVAVGTYHVDDTDNFGLVDIQSDGSWTAQAAPAPLSTAANQYLDLNSVACPAAGWCVATGNYATAAGPGDGVIETLSEGSWTEIQAPIPDGALPATLSDLACPAVGSCEVVGSYFQSSGAVVEDLSDGSWTETSPYGPSVLTGVACPAVESCVAVGTGSLGVPEVSTLADGDWASSVASIPSNGGPEPSLGHPVPDWSGAELWSVSCATVNSCAALGQYVIPVPGQPSEDNQDESLIETLGLGGVPTPVISSTDQATFTVGQAGTFTIEASGPSTPVLSEKGKLPKGLHFEKGAGVATISGKPSKKTGNYSLVITATATSSNERIGQPFLISVNS
jgi:hypothetical protein